MINLKVKVKIPFRDIVKEIHNPLLVYKINAVVQREIVGNILAGRSPVRGEGRFAPYRAQRNTGSVRNVLAGKRLSARTKANILAGRRKFYPYSVMRKFPDKKLRPVNLFLSGKMLSFYRAQLKDNQIYVGIADVAPSKVKVIAKAHQGGHTRGWFPARPLVPQKGQTFTVGVVQAFRDLYRERIYAILSRNKK